MSRVTTRAKNLNGPLSKRVNIQLPGPCYFIHGKQESPTLQRAVGAIESPSIIPIAEHELVHGDVAPT
jgi:hypothetical protein